MRICSGEMENLLKLCLFLLCFETAFTVQCILCPNYKDGECVHGVRTCTTQPGEACMIRRSWGEGGIRNLLSAESGCMKSCKLDEKISGTLTVHTYCCDYEDFCNDIKYPIMLP
ncbi:acrosomal protein SP-10-like [Psammomys obesus]|uniref:acrosomal protein SP-10-like n=1 Tax=Psammomys obesus TaxID=48139 RepID=UPI0024533AB8|nr:acrosomal protein SP-10-like [Psammomys obesus]